MIKDEEANKLNSQASYEQIEALAEANRLLNEDLNRWKRIEQKLQRSEEKYRILFEASGDAHFVLQSRAVMDCNQAALKLFGYSAKHDVLGMGLMQLVRISKTESSLGLEKFQEMIFKTHSQGSHTFEWQARTKDNYAIPVEILLTALPIEGGEVLQVVFRDISERKRAQEEAIYLAYYDALTGLPNRRLFLDRLEQSFENSRRRSHKLALLFIDLDRFKNINDSRGHAAGDELLQLFSARLQGLIRSQDTLARLGGDEFVVLMEDLDSNIETATAHASHLADKLLQSLESPIPLESGDCHITASIGVMVFPLGDESSESALQKADMAMYLAKQDGRNRVQVFHASIYEAVDRRIAMENELHKALANEQLDLNYQLQFDRHYRPVAVEALCRWNHPEWGDISPGTFIPIAEESGIIIELGKRVLQNAVAEIHKLNLRLHPDHRIRLSVNVSPQQLEHPSFIKIIEALCEKHDLPPGFLMLEITENTFMSDLNSMVELINRLRDMGIYTSLDDFGTGFSSLSYLKKLPIRELKIDTSFISELEHNNDDVVLVKSILAIGQHYRLQVVAEGVELRHHLLLLKTYGCDLFQGSLFARPMPAPHLEDFIQEQHRRLLDPSFDITRSIGKEDNDDNQGELNLGSN
ncbi:EAL domain-containing protein [uncultured Pseudoteredinibacter sp.]|uniref:putative bifunctional diguanylate cyclase/phosphodiesterase n=1 Tax=uncultured Pseudoteredinibacter sp. TaxID=1641701 RepID=UPI00261C5262|nr:EAL domain-containing protein [uncultured Pseudoteredinibacter sp.]